MSGYNFNKILDFKQRTSKEAQDIVRDFFEYFFFLAKDIEAINWVQGVPSYNDGDPCLFTTTTFALKPKKIEKDSYLLTEEIEQDTDFENYEELSFDIDDNTQQAINEAESFLGQSWSDSNKGKDAKEILQTAFGINKGITIYSDGTMEIFNSYLNY